MADEKKGELYEIINPSDPYTFRASDDKVAEAVVLILGEGKYACRRCSDGEDIGAMIAFIGKADAEKYIEENFGNLGQWLKAHRDEITEAMESVLCMGVGQRYTYESALELIEGDEKKKKYRDDVHDKLRSSMNDIGGYAWKLAAAYRRATEEEKRFPPYDDCESSLGCRCVIEDGKSKAVKDGNTCEACSKRDGLKKETVGERVIERHPGKAFPPSCPLMKIYPGQKK